MANITLKGNPLTTVGDLPAVGSTAKSFCLVGTDLAEVGLDSFKGKTVVLNVFPSIDTPVCAASVRKFNELASSRKNTVVLCVSADLPFAHGRFCEVEGLKNVHPVSVFRSDFGKEYGLAINSGVLSGLLSRAIIVIDAQGKMVYTEQVPEITQEPNYDAALAHLS